MKQTLSQEDFMHVLKTIGCGTQDIDKFIYLYENQMGKEMIRFLKCQRCTLLNDVHDIQKKIDCLDYLLYRLEKK